MQIKKIFCDKWFFIVEFLLFSDRSEDAKKIGIFSKRTFVSMKEAAFRIELDEHTA